MCNQKKIIFATEGLLSFRDIIPDDCVQTALQVMLAQLRLTKQVEYLEAAYDLFKRLKPELVPYHHDYYIAIMVNVMQTCSKQFVKEHKRTLYPIWQQVRQIKARKNCCAVGKCYWKRVGKSFRMTRVTLVWHSRLGQNWCWCAANFIRLFIAHAKNNSYHIWY